MSENPNVDLAIAILVNLLLFYYAYIIFFN